MNTDMNFTGKLNHPKSRKITWKIGQPFELFFAPKSFVTIVPQGIRYSEIGQEDSDLRSQLVEIIVAIAAYAARCCHHLPE
jgi:hypothetical protein